MLSLEAVIVGRNDEYEPNWERNLFAALAYNKALFAGTGVDYRAVFVEWNPLPSRPLLAPRLVEKLPFVRGIIVDPAIHDRICTSAELAMVLTVAFNAGFRTTGADFCLGTCGDIFLGTSVARAIADGLEESRLYRAERLTIRNDLPFPTATPELIEAPDNVLAIDSCSEPPFDKPPYTNAAGDFSLIDAGTMCGIRGYDESLTFARMHIDARLGWTAMEVVDSCQLLGRIYHVSHAHSHRTDTGKKVPGRIYNYTANIPYLNGSSWGLGDFDWQAISERLYRVSVPNGVTRPIPDHLTNRARSVAAQTADKLRLKRKSHQPEEPEESPRQEVDLFSLGVNSAVLPTGPCVTAIDNVLQVRTPPVQWDVACELTFPEGMALNADRYYWAELKVSVDEGAIGALLSMKGDLSAERYATPQDGPTRICVPITAAPISLVMRNVAESGNNSSLQIYSARVISDAKAH